MSWTIWMATAVVIASIYALVKRYENTSGAFICRLLNGNIVNEADDGFSAVR